MTLSLSLTPLQQLTSTSHSSLGYGFKTKELADSGGPDSSDDSEA